MRRVTPIAGLAFAVAGCALPAPYIPGPALPPVPPFQADQHTQYAEVGPATIAGQAFMKRRDGAVVTCAGETVWAYPATPFFRALVAYNAAGGPTSAVYGGNAAMNLARETRCDAQGNFVLSGLKATRWIVSTRVRWMAGNQPQGGILATTATAGTSQDVRTLLTDQDLIGQKSPDR